jgi:hypothetical protein
MAKEHGTVPEVGIIQKRYHRPLVVVGQRRQLLHQRHVRFRRLPELPLRLIQNRAKALFAAHRKNLPELRVHRVALGLRQHQPGREQFLRVGLLQSRKIQIAGICRKKSLVV